MGNKGSMVPAPGFGGMSAGDSPALDVVGVVTTVALIVTAPGTEPLLSGPSGARPGHSGPPQSPLDLEVG